MAADLFFIPDSVFSQVLQEAAARGVNTIPSTDGTYRVVAGVLSSETLVVSGGSVTQPAAVVVGAINALDDEGWRWTYPTPPASFDPDNSPETVTIQRGTGYNSSAVAAAPTDTAVITARIRQTFPNETSLTAEDTALSRLVYQSDTITDTTNNSTQSYLLPQAMWTSPDRLAIATSETNTLTTSIFVANHEARNGSPVAACVMHVTDGTNTISSPPISTLITKAHTASGLSLPVYEATLDISSLADGELTAYWVIYPHVGDPYNFLTDGQVYPNPTGVGVQKHYKMTNRRYAYVDPDSSGVGAATATDIVTARTTPFNSYTSAVAQAYSDNGNDTSGIVLELANGSTATAVLDGTAYNYAANGAVLEIRGEGAGADMTDTGANNASVTSVYMLFRNINFLKATPVASNNYGVFTRRANTDPVNKARPLIEFIDCQLLLNGTPASSIYFNHPGRVRFFNTVCEHVTCWNTNAAKYVESVGSTGPAGRCVYHVSASKPVGTVENEKGGTNLAKAIGQVCAFNELQGNGGQNCWYMELDSGPEGAAFVGNVAAMTGTPDTDDNMECYTEFEWAAENVNIFQNSLPGACTSVGFDNVGDGTESRSKQIFLRGNVIWRFKMEGDLDAKAAGPSAPDGGQPDGGRTVTMPLGYKVGGGHNVELTGTGSFNTPSGPGYARGVNEYLAWLDGGAVPGFANDASATGSNDHVAGDYRITINRSTMPGIPARDIPYPIDLYGTAFKLDGTDIAGAVQGT